MNLDFKKLEEQILSGKEVPVPEALRAWLAKERLLYIGGVFRSGKTGETFPTINPATEEVLAKVSIAEKDDVDAAVVAARLAFELGSWTRLSLKERAQTLNRLAEKILEHRSVLAILESLDSGKPLKESFDGDILRAAKNFQFFCEFAENERLIFNNEGERHTAFREPVGVVALITPWNLPLYLETWKVAPALLMGNSVVLKPSELTPLTASYLAELIDSVGIPKGVFNLIQGFGEKSAGEFLVSHPAVGAISFTGETSTGRAIMRSASVGPTRVSFELGGKGTSLVFADAPFDAVIEESVCGAFRNQGQICLAMPKILVEEPLYDRFLEAFLRRTQTIKIGSPLSYETTMGALVGKEHYEKVTGYLKKVEPPARILTGGKRPVSQPNGYFLEPTILTGISPEHPVACEEVFGPVVSVHPFKKEADAIRIANSTQYGLASCVWTTDGEKAARVAGQVRAGLTWLNCWFVRDLRVPFGGQKRSGLGREGGKWSLDFFSEWKSVCEKKGFYELEPNRFA